MQALRASQDAAFVIVDADGELVAGAVVTLTPLDGQEVVVEAGTAPTPVLDQFKTAFDPGLVLVRQGMSVKLRNSDPFNHHVYSFSPAKQFDAVMRANGDDKEILP